MYKVDGETSGNLAPLDDYTAAWGDGGEDNGYVASVSSPSIWTMSLTQAQERKPRRKAKVQGDAEEGLRRSSGRCNVLQEDSEDEGDMPAPKDSSSEGEVPPPPALQYGRLP